VDSLEGSVTSALPPRRAIAAASLIAAIVSAIPSSLQPASLATVATAGAHALAPLNWSDCARPLCRYLAARAYACWPLYQGHGLRTLLVYLEAVLALTRAQLVAQTSHAGDMSGVHALRDAIRQTDLLVVQLAAPERLAHAIDALRWDA
jgi:hypothetical protein